MCLYHLTNCYTHLANHVTHLTNCFTHLANHVNSQYIILLSGYAYLTIHKQCVPERIPFHYLAIPIVLLSTSGVSSLEFHTNDIYSGPYSAPVRLNGACIYKYLTYSTDCIPIVDYKLWGQFVIQRSPKTHCSHFNEVQ